MEQEIQILEEKVKKLEKEKSDSERQNVVASFNQSLSVYDQLSDMI